MEMPFREKFAGISVYWLKRYEKISHSNPTLLLYILPCGFKSII
ncbi:MAG: hypothetical protein JETT_3062 [Candidatus Jettenia ecosi]|uniref:Uncharacterized protein n=1 Tax=Candidatus Jettenia ecosi TaxID=2494326 RepID=A0A533Q7Q0_9BACT|nr:MAG: hypothetical protein JETT_3062 [Candidatus Jettenia ecosi]